jgi:uncharacterized protein GlcG (DUF336 family)
MPAKKAPRKLPMQSWIKVFAFIVAAALAPSAKAQAPLTEHNVSMGMSQAIIAGVIDQCVKDGFKVSVVIVDNAGIVRASLRGDSTPPHTMEFARRKAYTALTRRITSLEFLTQTETAPANLLRQIPDTVAIGGGVPIKIGNEVIGAVGVSGAPGGEKDEVCAKAGITKVADQLK